MTVVDIRGIFSDRNIQLADVNSSYVYYIEERNGDGHNNLFIMEYNRGTKRERLIANYSLEDPTFVEHIFNFEETMILVLENGSNSLWLIELDKKSGMEKNRRKVVCTGSFKECKALDESHLMIYMSPDQTSAEIFKKYKEVTGCECLCYLYNLESNKKHFVKSSLIAKVGCDGIKVLDVKGEKFAVLLDPYAEESIKENYYKEQRWINADIRDNIWLCKLSELEEDIESGNETVRKQSIASADIKALVRYMGIEKSKVYFRAKEFRSGSEKICSYDVISGSLNIEAALNQSGEYFYFSEEKPFKTFALTKGGNNRTYVNGLVNTAVQLSYDSDMGDFVTCIDERYIVTQRTLYGAENGASVTYCFIYDSKLDKNESYACRSFAEDDTLILY